MDQRRLFLLGLLVFVCFTSGDNTEELKENEDIEQNDQNHNEKISNPSIDKFEKLNSEEQKNVNEDSKAEEIAPPGEVLSEKQSTLSEEDSESTDSSDQHAEIPSESVDKPTEKDESGDGVSDETDDGYLPDVSAIISKVLVVKDNITGHKHSSFSEDKSTDRGDEKTTTQVKEEAEKRIEQKEKEKQNAADEPGKDAFHVDSEERPEDSDERPEDSDERPEDSEEYSPDAKASDEEEEVEWKVSFKRKIFEESPPSEEASEGAGNMAQDSTYIAPDAPIDEKLDEDETPQKVAQDTSSSDGQNVPDTENSDEKGVQDTPNLDEENVQGTGNSEDGSHVQDSSVDTPSSSEQDNLRDESAPSDKTSAEEESGSLDKRDVEDEDIMKEDKLYRATHDEAADSDGTKTDTKSMSESKVDEESNKVVDEVLEKSEVDNKVVPDETAEMKTDSVTKHKKQEKKIQPGAALYDEAMDLLKAGKKDMKKAYRMLGEAAIMNNTDAAEKIAYPFLFGDNIKRNRTKAIRLFHLMAERGIPLGQQGLGFVYGAGLSVNSSQAKALIYTTFGALGGDPMAHMMLGYRYFNGIGVAKSCESALTHYKKVAKKVTDETTSHGGNAVQRVRLYDELEQPGGTSAQIDEDLLQYYQFLADKGDLQAQVGLGQLYFQGGRGIDVNYEKAFKYFQLAGDVENGNGLAYLGKMYLDGLHVEKDQKKAFDYFTKAAAQSNPIGQAGLGMIYLKGDGVPQDYDQAMKYFSQAAEQGWVEGQLQLGNMYYNGVGVKKDYRQAVKYFTFASQSGHVMAFYNLASMHATGAGVMRSCNTAAELFKNVAERGKWSMMFMDAYDSYRAGDLKTALLKYYYLAELGYEVAQSNVAYVLEKGEMPWFSQNETYARALLQWSRAASQGYAVARVKVGDYHFYGYGTKVDYDTSALHYRMASDQQNNPQAMFNLGYMHERGFGLKEDIHLAKRFYDMAAEASPDAHFPVTLALLKLSMHFMYEWLQNNYKFWEYAPVERLKLVVLQKLGPDWDMYLITLLAVLLGGLLLFRRTLRR